MYDKHFSEKKTITYEEFYQLVFDVPAAKTE